MTDTQPNSLLLLRGLPGSGKSTLAGLLNEHGKYPVYAIDDYFTDAVTGLYAFNHLNNHLAYAQCQRLTEESMQHGVSKIIVDNTFTLPWEMEPYFKLCSAYHYRLFVATVENYHGSGNIHGVAEEQLQKMAAKYHVKLF